MSYKASNQRKNRLIKITGRGIRSKEKIEKESKSTEARNRRAEVTGKRKIG